MSDSGTSDIETLEIKQRNLSRNSNGHNFSHGGPIQAHHIWRRPKLNNGSSQEIEMVITFHSNVRFRRIIYRYMQNQMNIITCFAHLSPHPDYPDTIHGKQIVKE